MGGAALPSAQTLDVGVPVPGHKNGVMAGDGHAHLHRHSYKTSCTLQLSMAEATSTSVVGGLPERPTCVICLGMAGSGKTTFVQVRTYIHIGW